MAWNIDSRWIRFTLMMETTLTSGCKVNIVKGYWERHGLVSRYRQNVSLETLQELRIRCSSTPAMRCRTSDSRMRLFVSQAVDWICKGGLDRLPAYSCQCYQERDYS